MSAIWLVALLSVDARAACPPVVDLSHDWVNATNGLKTPVPAAGGDAVRFVLRVTNTDSTGTATNLVLIDSLPTYTGTASLASLPAGWTADLTQSGTGGSLIGRFAAAELGPAASVTIMIDLSLTSSGCPLHYLSSAAVVTSSGYCATSNLTTPVRTAAWAVSGHFSVVAKVLDAGGTAVRSFPVYQMGCPPASFRLEFASGPGCAAPVADSLKPLTPDGDCLNDRVVISIDATAGGPMSPWPMATWDGRDDPGRLVPCGTYVVRVDSVNTNGSPYSITRPIEVGCVGWERAGGPVRIIGGRDGVLRLTGGPESGRDRATIAVQPTGPGEVKARLYDQAGRFVRELSGVSTGSGPVILEWDGRDRSGRDVSPGIHLVLITGPGIRTRERIVVSP